MPHKMQTLTGTLIDVHKRCGKELAGTFFIRLIYFIAWPYMVLVFQQEYGLDALHTGALLFIATLTAFFATQVAGSAIDRGRLHLIFPVASLLLMSGLALLLVHSLSAAVVGLNLLVLATRTLETGFKVNLSDRASREIVESAHNARYYYVNVSGALAPALVALLGLQGRDYLLYGSLVLALLIGLYTLFYRAAPRQNASSPGLGASLLRIFRDKAFLQLCAFSILFYMVMASNDTVLLMLLSQHLPQRTALHFYATIQVINTLMVLIAYFPLNHAVQRFTLRTRISVALFVMMLSQLMIFFHWLQNGLTVALFALVFTFGELVAISASNYAMELLTPTAFKGGYFSFYNIYMTGMALAPLLGGAFINAGIGDSWYLFTTGTLLVAAIIFNRLFADRDAVISTEAR
ncbi:MFS transporter [Erwinia sp. 9145]|uniref:MFS transporter n=1 Tax=Erwinia sp. 9145 TaxID=1500895 RepID=UPI000552D559|nr:MFS transporter [Erwinia sp. 9145]